MAVYPLQNEESDKPVLAKYPKCPNYRPSRNILHKIELVYLYTCLLLMKVLFVTGISCDSAVLVLQTNNIQLFLFFIFRIIKKKS